MNAAHGRHDEAALRTLIADWSRAVEAKDPQAIVAAYTPNTVLYDAIPPAKTVGAAAIAQLWSRCFLTKGVKIPPVKAR